MRRPLSLTFLAVIVACGGKVRSEATPGAGIGDAGSNESPDAGSDGGGPVGAGTTLVALATATNCAAQLALDSANVYWTGGPSNVWKVPIAGGTPTELAFGERGSFAIAVDATSVYWTSQDNPGVTKVGLDGGTPTVLAPSLDGSTIASADSLTVAGDSVYCTTNNGVVTFLTDGGAPRSLSSKACEGAVVVQGSSVFWGAYVGGGIYRTPLDGGTSLVVAATEGTGGYTFAVDATKLYYFAGGYIRSIGLVDQISTILATGSPEIYGIAVDSTNLYWSQDCVWTDAGTCSAMGGAILKVPLGGGAPTVLVSHARPGPIAIDSSSVYWANADDENGETCTIMKATPK